MFHRTFAFGGPLLVAAALVFLAPGAGFAQRGGFHGGGLRGGFHASGVRFGASRGGYQGGYHSRPYSGGYPHGWYHNRPYHGGYYGYYPSYYPSYPDYSYGYSPYYASAVSWGPVYSPWYPAPLYSPAPPFPDGSLPATASAHVTVTVPANARVWFDGTALTSTGTVRQYLTQPLTPGRQYTYWVRARWNENGHEVNQLQPVEVITGARVNLRFPAPPSTGG